LFAAKAWSNTDSFMQFIMWFVWQIDSRFKALRRAGRWAVLLVDSHTSRLNPDMLTYALQHRVHLIGYPTHATSLLQALDVSVHAPFKKEVSRLINLLDNEKEPLSVNRLIRDVIIPAWRLTFSPENIKAGFKATGVEPRNANAIDRSKLTQSELFKEGTVVVEHKGKQFPFADGKQSDAKDAAPDVVMNPVPPELQAVLGKPVLRTGKKGGTEHRSTFFTQDSFIAALRNKKGKKAGKTKPAAKKPAAKRSASRKPNGMKSKQDSESEPEESEEEDSESKEEAEADGSEGKQQQTGNGLGLGGLSSDPRKKRKRGADTDWETGAELKSDAAENNAQPAESKEPPIGVCHNCDKVVAAGSDHLACSGCENIFHTGCISARMRQLISGQYWCKGCKLVIPK